MSLSNTARFLLLLLLAGFASACEPVTTEQAGPDPRLEAEVERLREALAGGPPELAGKPLVVALVDSGELRWVRGFGQEAGGGTPDPGRVFAASRLLPTLLAVALERLVDQGRLSLTDARRGELMAATGEAQLTQLIAELEKGAGRGWREALQQEILEPLAMKKTSLGSGPPSLATDADNLVRLMVDLQKANAGRNWRRLEQAGAQRLLRPMGAAGHGFGLDFGGEGQSGHFFRYGRDGEISYAWVGFFSSGNGAVVFGPSDAAVSAALHRIANTYDWPALKD